MKLSQAERNEVRTENEVALARNEAAIKRLLANNERFRSEIGKSINSTVKPPLYGPLLS